MVYSQNQLSRQEHPKQQIPLAPSGQPYQIGQLWQDRAKM